MELIERLIRACVAGCTCNTKSPDIQHHDPQCHYRLFIEAGDQIAELEAALTQCRELLRHNAEAVSYGKQRIVELEELFAGRTEQFTELQATLRELELRHREMTSRALSAEITQDRLERALRDISGIPLDPNKPGERWPAARMKERAREALGEKDA